MRVSHGVTAVTDDPNLVSCAGLVPVLELADRAGLPRLAAEYLTLTRLGGANRRLRVPALVAGMVAGADSIDIEQVIADLKNRPLARLPSGRFWANSAWLVCAAIAFNLTRAAGALASIFHARATTATVRAHLITVPGRLARSARRLTLHLPQRWPWDKPGNGSSPAPGTARRYPPDPRPSRPPRTPPETSTWKSRANRPLSHPPIPSRPRAADQERLQLLAGGSGLRPA